MTDLSDSNTTPVVVRSAATVMLVDDRPDLQVFMMERSAKSSFGASMWVFPGGAVDAGDDAARYQEYCVHRTEQEASRDLGLERGGLAYYVAAIREAFEEAGVLLAIDQKSHVRLELEELDVQQRFDRLRDELNASKTDLFGILDGEGLLLDAGEMHYVARWITPPGPPRRFDTRFFVARMPGNQHPVHDDAELVHSRWFSPADILSQAENQQISLMPPTMRMLECLAEFQSAEEVIEAAAENLPDVRVPMGGMGGDNAADIGQRIVAEPGWVRLRPTRP